MAMGQKGGVVQVGLTCVACTVAHLADQTPHSETRNRPNRIAAAIQAGLKTEELDLGLQPKSRERVRQASTV